MTTVTQSKIRAAIAGTGMFVPPKVVKNTDLEKLMDTSDEWIRQRSGIEERRHVDNGMQPSELAEKAALLAIKDAGCTAKDIDCILVATLSPEHGFPGTSAFLQHRLGLESTPAFDLRAQCSGFLYGLNTARAYIESGIYKRVLLVGCEVHSNGLDYTTRGRDVAVLFGDGAGAAVIEKAPDDRTGILSVHMHSQGEFANKLWMEYPAFGHKDFIPRGSFEDGSIYPKMEGRFVFKHAVSRMPEAVNEALEANGMEISDVDFFLFHQANLRINEHVAGHFGIPPEKTYNNIQKYGNTSAASIPILIDECRRTEKISRGSTVCMAAFGAGFTWASAIVRF